MLNMNHCKISRPHIGGLTKAKVNYLQETISEQLERIDILNTKLIPVPSLVESTCLKCLKMIKENESLKEKLYLYA